MTKYIKITLTSLVLLPIFLVFVTQAEARTVVRTGETVSLAEDQMIEGDFYSAAGKVNISGEISEDLVTAGGQVKLNGTVGADATIIGAAVDSHGTIGDDLRIMAGEVTIAEPVMGDLFVLGGAVTILSSASVSGDVIVFASQVTIEGSVGGDVLGRFDTLRIDSEVAGDVDVSVINLTLGERASIGGSVKYVSNNLAIQALNANVSGDLVRNDPILPGAASSIKSIAVPVLVLLFSALVWFLISRKSLIAVSKKALVMSPKPAFLGSAVILFAPLVIGMLMVSVIGTLVGMIAFAGYLLFILLSAVGSSVVVGHLMMSMFNQPDKETSLITVIVGVIGVGLLMLVPFVGPFIIIGFAIITLGAIVDLLIGSELK